MTAEKKPYLIEWAVGNDDDTSPYGPAWDFDTSEESARQYAKASGLRLFRIEWTEVES